MSERAASSPSISWLGQRNAVARGLLLATFFGGLTALSAQAAIRLPFTPVPVTGQVFLVLLAAGRLGGRLAALSQIEYLARGLAGLPVFAGGTAGPLVFIGPSGGYLVGFVAGAFVAGSLVQRWSGKSLLAIGVALACGVAILYSFGVLWLAIWLAAAGQARLASALPMALAQGVLPFLLADAVKLGAAAGIVRAQRALRARGAN